jgi:hypothetical protein
MGRFLFLNHTIRHRRDKEIMPSQEFYAILEMIVYPDVIEPENLRVHPEHEESGHVASHAGCKPFININLN